MIKTLMSGLVAAAVATALPASAQTPATTPAPNAAAARRTGDIHLDGRLDESAWSAAPAITQFTQRTPSEGKPATQRTEVHVLYDDQAIYIGARMFDNEGAKGVRSRLVRRDAAMNSDELDINFDAYHDRLHNVLFKINPAGVRGDALEGDASWDPVWEAATSQDSSGWSAELRIPLSQLHFSHDEVQTWGFQITRIVQRLNETDLWSFVPLNQSMVPAYYGDLTGLSFEHQPSHLELLPYASTRMQRLSSDDPASPFYDPNRLELRVGGDLRYPITPSLTLSATVNPDFGQVEVDPAVVNLSAFETFFSEKRPFFVEGGSLFSFGSPGCIMNCGFGLFPFYTRRVGRAPQAVGLAYQQGEFVDAPTTTNILAAAKVTGRTQGGTSVGVMNALVGAQHARVAAEDGTERVLIEPLTNDFVARVNHEMHGGNLTFGGIATSVDRQLGDNGIASLLPGHARLVGVDGQIFWDKHTHSAYAALIGSDVGGDSAAILRLQRSSARFFQRPDRDVGHNGLFTSRFDPGLTSLRGYGAIARVADEGGDWQWDLNASTISPGFESNDLGFQQVADFNWVNGALVRQFTKPTHYYRTLLAIVGAEQQWNSDGDMTGRDATLVLQTTFLNYWNASIFAQTAASFFDERLLRGGPTVMRPGNKEYLSLSMSSDARKKVSANASVTRVLDVEGGFYNSIGAGVTLRPAPNISIGAGPQFSRGLATDQYVTSVADPTATSFGGRRYVLAHILQNTASMTVRANMTFTPALSLEVFAQPLIASGDYTDFEEFSKPRVMKKLIYGQDVGTISAVNNGESYRIDPDGNGPAVAFNIGNPDFNFRSLRGTAVLRWEWRAGSTLFLAWTQERAGVAGVGDFDFARDRSALFAAQPDNVFVLKVSYWLSR